MNHAVPSQQKAFGHILGQQYTVFDGLAGMYVEAFYQDRHGLLWIGTTDGGISRFDGAHFDTFGLSDGLPHLSVTAIDEDADGRLLFGTFGGGLAAYDGRGFQVYTTEHGLPSNDIFGLQPQADGSVRVLTMAVIAGGVEIKMLFQGREGDLIACTSTGQLGRIEANRFIAIEDLQPQAL